MGTRQNVLRLLFLLALVLVELALAASLDYYKILGIGKTSSERDVKSAYRRKSKQWHPDKHKEDKEEAEQRFVEVAEGGRH